jgi:uncharacterized protein
MADDPQALSRYVVSSPRLRLRGDAHRRVLFSTRRNRPIVVSESVWAALQADCLSTLSPATRAMLAEGGILVDRNQDELATVLRENKAAIAANRTLKHVIQPTAACQLGCDYCGQEHFARQLSTQHQDSLLELLRKRLASSNYGKLTVTWFGAEPLLGIKVMRRLSPKLASLAKEHEAAYSSTLVTNGLRLTLDIALELEHHHYVEAAEITLDGPAETHDLRRHVKNGDPTFSKILGNLVDVARSSDITMQLSVRCNVDRRNADSVSELIDLLGAAELHTRIALHFAPVYSWGNDADANALGPDEFASREIEWFAQMARWGFAPDLLPHRKEIVCLAVHREGELTDALGTIFNCTEVSQVPTYGQPNRFALRSLDEEEGQVSPPFRQFNDEIARGKHSLCGECQMLPTCGGACPKQWSEGNTPCPSAKTNIAERLTLWYALNGK